MYVVLIFNGAKFFYPGPQGTGITRDRLNLSKPNKDNLSLALIKDLETITYIRLRH